MRVVVVRHCEAAPGQPDDERPLTAAGRASAHALGERLAQLRPGAVLSSPLLRARETAGPIAEAAGLLAETDERLAPGATAASVRAAVAGRAEPIVVVGHQPDVGRLVQELTGREVAFPPGGIAEVEL